MKKIIRTILLVGLLALVSYLAIKIISGFKENAKAFEENLPSIYSLTAEDSNLLSKSYVNRIKVNEVLRSKVRNPISFITVEGKYDLIIYKIDLIQEQSLLGVLNIERKSIERSSNVTYRVIANKLFSFQYKSGKAPLASKIYLTFAGDSWQTTSKGDSIIGYHLLFKNISIRYSDEGPIDFFIKSNRGMKVQMDILFLKRNKSCYLLLLTPKDDNIDFSADLLSEIVSGS